MTAAKQKETERLLTVQELSEKTGISVGFLRKAKSSYSLPHYKIGGMVKFKMTEVELWIKQRKAG